MSVLQVPTSLCAYGVVVQLLVISLRVGQGTRHHGKHFKEEIQDRKFGASESTGRSELGERRSRRPPLDLSSALAFRNSEAAACLSLPLSPLLSAQETARNW